jgi:uncharacterized protein YaaN involved in tellurite resistance
MSDFELTAPRPLNIDDASGSDGIKILDAKRRAELDVKARQFAGELVAMDPESPQYADRVVQLAAIGTREIEALSAIVQRPRAQPGSASAASGNVGRSLTELRAIAQSLDPARAGDLLQPRKLFGLIPMGDRLKGYFASFLSAQSRINDVLSALAVGRDHLLRDTVSIEAVRAKMRHSMSALEERIYVTSCLDSRFERMAEELEAAQPGRAYALRKEPIFQLRQRRTELLTHMTVAKQAYLAISLIRNSNLELVEGVDQARTMTVAALQTAVMVADAVGNQRLVMDQIRDLKGMAKDITSSAEGFRHDASNQIERGGASSRIQIESLRRAFADIYASIDGIHSSRSQASAVAGPMSGAISSRSSVLADNGPIAPELRLPPV